MHYVERPCSSCSLQSGAIDARELEHLLRWPRPSALPAMSDELQAWMGEAQWAALVPLAQLPTFAGLLKVRERDGWDGWCGSARNAAHLNAFQASIPYVL